MGFSKHSLMFFIFFWMTINFQVQTLFLLVITLPHSHTQQSECKEVHLNELKFKEIHITDIFYLFSH